MAMSIEERRAKDREKARKRREKLKSLGIKDTRVRVLTPEQKAKAAENQRRYRQQAAERGIVYVTKHSYSDSPVGRDRPALGGGFGRRAQHMRDGTLYFGRNFHELGSEGLPIKGGIWAETNKECGLNFSIAFKRAEGSALLSVPGPVDGDHLVIACVCEDSWAPDGQFWDHLMDVISGNGCGATYRDKKLMLVGNVEKMQAGQKWVAAKVEIQILNRVGEVFSGQMYLAASDGLTHAYRVTFPREGKVDALVVGSQAANEMIGEMVHRRPKVVQGVPKDERDPIWHGALCSDGEGFCRGLAVLTDYEFDRTLRKVSVNEPIEVVDVLFGPLNLQRNSLWESNHAR